MNEITIEEAKKFELDILLAVARFCDEHGLRYFLAYGSLIGAVRHKGFIPWDDDVDINMPRSDYDYLIEHFNSENPESQYRLISPYDKIARHSFVKVIDTRTIKIEKNVDYKNGYLGVDIDIFPLDGQPSDEKEYAVWWKKLHALYKLFLISIIDPNKNLKRFVGVHIVRLITGGKNSLLKKAEKLHKMYPYEECGYVGSTESVFDDITIRFKRDWFDTYTEAEFEGHIFKIPVGYDDILTAVYGNYMQPPPPEEQKQHHSTVMYLID